MIIDLPATRAGFFFTEITFYARLGNHGTMKQSKQSEPSKPKQPRFDTLTGYANAITTKEKLLDKLHHEQYLHMINSQKDDMDQIIGLINQATDEKKALELEQYEVMGLGKGSWFDSDNDKPSAQTVAQTVKNSAQSPAQLAAQSTALRTKAQSTEKLNYNVGMQHSYENSKPAAQPSFNTKTNYANSNVGDNNAEKVFIPSTGTWVDKPKADNDEEKSVFDLSKPLSEEEKLKKDISDAYPSMQAMSDEEKIAFTQSDAGVAYNDQLSKLEKELGPLEYYQYQQGLFERSKGAEGEEKKLPQPQSPHLEDILSKPKADNDAGKDTSPSDYEHGSDAGGSYSSDYIKNAPLDELSLWQLVERKAIEKLAVETELRKDRDVLLADIAGKKDTFFEEQMNRYYGLDKKTLDWLAERETDGKVTNAEEFAQMCWDTEEMQAWYEKQAQDEYDKAYDKEVKVIEEEFEPYKDAAMQQEKREASKFELTVDVIIETSDIHGAGEPISSHTTYIS